MKLRVCNFKKAASLRWCAGFAVAWVVTVAVQQELFSERARLAAEVESLKASTVAEAVTNKAELGAQRDRLEQQAADLAARAEALAAGELPAQCSQLQLFSFHIVVHLNLLASPQRRKHRLWHTVVSAVNCLCR